MVGHVPSGVDRIPHQILEMRRAIDNLLWWQVIKKIKYKSRLREMRCIGASIGFNQAIKELEDAGIICSH